MSRKNPYVVKASLVSKTTASKGKLFSVVATLSNKDFDQKKYELAKYGCKSCKTEFAAIKGKEPFCVVCSSTQVNEIKSSTKIENLKKIPESSLASVHCGNCQTHNVITLETAHMLDTKMHCVECGTEMEYKLDDDEDLENTDIVTDDDSLVDTDEVIQDEDVEVSEEETDTEEAELNDNDETGTDEPETNTNIDTALETEKVKLPSIEKQEPVKTETSDTSITDDGAGAGKIDLSDTDEFDLIDVVEGQLEIYRSANTIVASKAGVPVAILEEANCTADHAGMFNANSFIKAIKYTASQQGDKALASFNFTNTKVKLPIPKIIESKVNEKVTASTLEAETKLQSLNEDFQHCLQLASAGLNKGFWKGKENVLKASFIENLETVGVRNAESLVSKVFAQHAQTYHIQLLETANTLMSKSLELRNELAETLGEVNYTDDEDYDGNEELEARLESASLSIVPIQKAKPVKLVTSSVSDIVSTLKNSTGRVF